MTNECSNFPLPLIQHIGLLSKKLMAKKIMLAGAESCTGGLMSALCTELAGSSSWFKGGIVAYSNSVKMDILKVSEATINSYGAVSSQTAEEMVLGVNKIFKTNVSFAVTGIAGPSGGTKEKPVGTVWIAAMINNKVTTKLLNLNGNRANIRIKSVENIIDLILELI